MISAEPWKRSSDSISAPARAPSLESDAESTGYDVKQLPEAIDGASGLLFMCGSVLELGPGGSSKRISAASSGEVGSAGGTLWSTVRPT